MAWVAAAAAAVGAVVEGVEANKSANIEGDIMADNAAKEQEAMRKQHRAEFGSMLSQAGSSGISGSSFQDIFNNQTIEDSIAMTGLRQKEENLKTAIENKKRANKVQTIMKVGQAVALGASSAGGGGGGMFSKLGGGGPKTSALGKGSTSGKIYKSNPGPSIFGGN
jgi:hypothetical protein